MKQILVLLALSAMLVCSCSSGDDNTEPKQEWPAFTLDKTEVEIYAHETADIIPSEAFTAWSENKKVATVDADGTIHGLSEGETDIVFKANASGKETRCLAKVFWRYHYFEEPFCEYEATLEMVKLRETHRIIREDITSYRHTITYDYSDQEIPMTATYYFSPSGKEMRIRGANLTWEKELSPFDKIRQQLEERYEKAEAFPIAGIVDMTYYSEHLLITQTLNFIDYSIGIFK